MLRYQKLCSVNQRYNLKAIHNQVKLFIVCSVVVLSKSKIQSKSNSQQVIDIIFNPDCCAQ